MISILCYDRGYIYSPEFVIIEYLTAYVVHSTKIQYMIFRKNLYLAGHNVISEEI